ncbi:hypothetical protein [Rothia nasimurium]|uniref:hypothetical protein n=1 Tax=Rothia nasimurium TaxID=85336 RepID=UPI001F3508BD|nr:hypothetical protein [Rothia nasimurium]
MTTTANQTRQHITNLLAAGEPLTEAQSKEAPYCVGMNAADYIVRHYAAALENIEAITPSPARAAQLLQAYTTVFLNREPWTNYTNAATLSRLNLPAADLADLERAGVIEAAPTKTGDTDYCLAVYAQLDEPEASN